MQEDDHGCGHGQFIIGEHKVSQFHIKFRACPTNFNPPQYIQFDQETLREYVHLAIGNDKVEFTEKAKRELAQLRQTAMGNVIQTIYTESDDMIVEYYKYNGYGAHTVTAALRNILSGPKLTISADME